MTQDINRGSCLPANLTRATKPALIDEVQRTAAELADARELLRAIAETCQADDVVGPARRLGRIQSAAEGAAAGYDYGRHARSLRALLADDRGVS